MKQNKHDIPLKKFESEPPQKNMQYDDQQKLFKINKLICDILTTNNNKLLFLSS